ncbi:DUF5777 family beta-barrel protein [Flavobacteriaceae bacterium 14752]|uniref:DUF5777 family beta-barrel protein n=1 Tax=Mesohalobacter salilacus TaxID=2491711 RepID=UPI000F63AEAE|nr:hypothetical protein EIG84_01480 [Flavobacteriaceae bacterium 14752]
MNKFYFSLCFIVTCWSGLSQDLLASLDTITQPENKVSHFKGLKIVNFESTKLASQGDFYFVVSHRFSSITNGFDDFFGLDNAVTQLKFIYGFTDWLNVGVARSSLDERYGIHAKYRIYEKNKDLPIKIVGYHLVTANTALKDDDFPEIEFKDRLSYVNQIIISTAFTKDFSFEMAPTYIHQNLATRSIISQEETSTFVDQTHDEYLLGLGGRYKISKRLSINMDYGIHFNRVSGSNFRNPLAVGLNIETGGHIFQVHFSNAQGMFEDAFISRATGDWSEGDIFFGFNLFRVF